jgi:hypothetical protein
MGMFIMLSIGSMILGISIYNNTNQVSLKNYEQRTALSYIANQVRLNDSAGSVSVIPFDSANALTLNQEIDGVLYQTLLYSYEGKLREIFTEDGIPHQPDSGAVIIPTETLNFDAYDGCVRVSLGNLPGSVNTLILCPRSD